MIRKEFLRVFCLLIICQLALVYCNGPMYGPADINIKKIVQCENPEQYPSYLALERRKVSRTLEMYSGDFNLDVDLDETTDFYLNVEKWGDGGFKPNFLVINETDVCEFLFKYIKDEITNILKLIGRPPACPITAGFARLDNYSIDYDSLKQDMLYGDFKGRVILAKDDEPKLCFEVYAETKPKYDYTKYSMYSY